MLDKKEYSNDKKEYLGTLIGCLDLSLKQIKENYKESYMNEAMTREEALDVIRINIPNLYDEDFGYSLCDKVEAAVTALEKPITLAEFLGWEEGQEYEVNSQTFRLQGNDIQIKAYNEWQFPYDVNVNYIMHLRQAKKVGKKTKDELLDELQELVSSEKINDIIKQLRESE